MMEILADQKGGWIYERCVWNLLLLGRWVGRCQQKVNHKSQCIIEWDLDLSCPVLSCPVIGIGCLSGCCVNR